MNNYLLWNSSESSILLNLQNKEKLEINTHKGKIKIENYQDLKYGNILISSTGKRFYVIPPTHKDKHSKITRKTNTFTIKDLSIILAYTSITKESLILEIGTGSAAGTIFFSNFVKKIISIDTNFYNLQNSYKNINKLNLFDNIQIILANQDNLIFKESIFDAIIIDLPEPEKYSKFCNYVLKSGGDLVFAVPNIEQVKNAREKFSKENFVYFRTVEIWLREWLMRPSYCRPHHEMQAHSMFLTFCKKINHKNI